MRKHLMPALRYNLRDYFRSAGVFIGVIVLVMAFFTVQVSVNGNGDHMALSGMAIASSIFLFVLGVADCREKLRLLNQFGLSRNTAYQAELIALAVLAVAVAAALEVVTGLFQLFVGGSGWFYAGDLYQIIYLWGDKTLILTFGQHVTSVLFNACLTFLMAVLGQFFSLLFWRLSKRWAIAVGVSIPVLCNLIPWSIYRASALHPVFSRVSDAIVRFWSASAWNFMLTCLLLSAVIIGVNWLLLRRAIIRAPR